MKGRERERKGMLEESLSLRCISVVPSLSYLSQHEDKGEDRDISKVVKP